VVSQFGPHPGVSSVRRLGQQKYHPNKCRLDALELLPTRLWGSMRVRQRGQAVGDQPGALPPAIEGRTIHAQTAGNDGSGFTMAQEFNTPTTPSFQFFRCSNRSTHARLDAPSRETVHWLRRCQ
jgi:hypothetical protein